MTEFFREVDEDVRRDRIIQIWTKYRYIFIGLAVLLVAGTGAWRVYEHYRDEAAEAASAKFEAAAQLARDGKSAEAAAAYEALSKTAPSGYASLARLRAAAEISASDPQAAIKAYEALADDPASIRPSRMSPNSAPRCCASTATILWTSNGDMRRSPRTLFPIVFRFASFWALPP